MNPLISVIVPTYQHARMLPFSLNSIFAQTYARLEVIVVNDGSTDNTLEVLEPYKDRITLINQENQGSNPARNRGLREATGEFVIFADADVRMRPDMLEKMMYTLDRHPEASFVYSAFKFGWKRFKGIPFDKDLLRQANYIHTTSLVRRQDFPGFDPDIKRLQDWDVWLTMAEQGRTGVLIPEILFHVTVDGASRIGSSWLPSFLYYIPWKKLGWKPKAIKAYDAARAVIAKKHHL